MRVGVDGRSLRGQGRGVALYTSALVQAYRAAFPADELIVEGRRTRSSYAAGALLGRPRLTGDYDVFLLPAPAPVAVGRTPYVLVVHDRSWERRPGDFTAYERLWHRIARPRTLARRAAAVIASSQATADELREAWAVEAHAIPLAPRAMPPPSAPPGRPYFLWVGALEPRKAPDVLAAAWRLAGPDAELRVAGAGRLEVAGAIHEGRVDDARLATLYAGARALVLPSHLEGFGLPAVEALAHGTPVIASDIPALREVCGDDARYVTPGAVDELAAALLDPPPPPRVRPARTWTDVARETRAVLHGALR